MEQLATIIFIIGIAGLFFIDRDLKRKRSLSIWIPAIWLMIAGSRPVTSWLGLAPASSPEHYLEGSPVDRVVFSMLLFAGIIVLLQRRNAVSKILSKNRLIIAFVLYCALSAFWSDFPGITLKRWIKSLGDYVMVLIILSDQDWVANIKKVFSSVSFILIPLSVLFVKFYPDLGRHYATWGTQSYVGVASDKNMLGMICMIFGLAASWRMIHAFCAKSRNRSRVYIVHGTIFLMAIWLLLISNSMTSLACFMITNTLIAMHALSKTGRKRWVVHMSVVAIVLAISSVLFFDIGGDVLQDVGRNPTLTGRTAIWNAILDVPINPAVGAGYESFWLGERLQKLWAIRGVTGVNEAHNGYIEMYLNLGWIGIGFLGLLLWTGYKNILRLLEHNAEAGRLRLAFFVIAVVYSFTEAGFRGGSMVWIAFLLTIIDVPQKFWQRIPARQTSSVSPAFEEARTSL